jgi:predicted nucleic acid-binding Zn ribbon protein
MNIGYITSERAMDMHECHMCHKKFDGRKKKYCSDECRFEYDKLKKREVYRIENGLDSRQCNFCSKPFTPKTNGASCKYCSELCEKEKRIEENRERYRKKNGLELPDETPTKCEVCLADISHKRFGAKYCSKKCKNKADDRKKGHKPWEEWVEEQALNGARQRLATSLVDYVKRRETIRTVECAYCKAEFKTFDQRQNYCSSEHRAEHKKQLEWEAMPAKECVVCGSKFKHLHPNAITCSKKCSKRHSNKTNRKNRYNNNTIVVDKDITLEKLYQRDKGICHICNGECNPLDYDRSSGYFVVGKTYPSIDHVQPRSKGGVHSWDNVKLAHHYCNTIKNNNENKEEVINKINDIKERVRIR